MEDEKTDIYDLGLTADVEMMNRSPIDRRRILKMGLAGIGMLLAGCATLPSQSSGAAAPTGTTSASGNASTSSGSASSSACVTEIPEETNGPYPADGSNASNQSLNALTLSGIVRNDIRTSLGTGNTAAGIPLTVELTLIDSDGNCAPLAGHAIYIWHCSREGAYSLYSNGVTEEDYLRGVQETDANGKVTFTTIYPGCYAGRWPHIHFEIYPSLAEATSVKNVLNTSQLAFPEDVCKTVYATDGYSASVRNLSQISLKTDNVFSDGYETQMATLTGDVTNGYTAKLTVGVNA